MTKFIFLIVKGGCCNMSDNKRTHEEMLLTCLEALVTQNKHLCALVSELSESVSEIEHMLTENRVQKQKINKLQLEADFGKDDSNSIPHVPHQPYPIEKLAQL